MIYTYDGTFWGYLSAVFTGWRDGLGQVEDIQQQALASLFVSQDVPTDTEKAGRILRALQEQCGQKAVHFLYYGFLAEQPGREMALLRYLRLAFRYQGHFYSHLSEEPLWLIREWARKTGNERHTLLGLLRFQELADGMLYGRINPTCCVVPVMAPHFMKRLANETWVIHDVRRHLGVYYQQGQAELVEIPKTLAQVDVTADERKFAQLWQRYYQSIAIGERRNERLRRQYMPKKYWPYIGELRNLNFLDLSKN